MFFSKNCEPQEAFAGKTVYAMWTFWPLQDPPALNRRSSRTNCVGQVTWFLPDHCLPKCALYRSLTSRRLPSQVYLPIQPSSFLRFGLPAVAKEIRRLRWRLPNSNQRCLSKLAHSGCLQSNQVKRFAQESRLGFVVQNLNPFFVQTSQIEIEKRTWSIEQ